MQPTSTLAAPARGRADHAPQSWGTGSLLPTLFAIAGQALAPGRAERQLSSVVHQICWNEKARRKLAADPEGFIGALKVAPQVKAVLSMMRESLLASRVITPEFSWWWGRQPDQTETEGEALPLGEEALPYTLSCLAI